MASRKKTEIPKLNVSQLLALFTLLLEFNATEENPVTVQEMNEETGLDTFESFGILADAELIEFDRGRVWIIAPDVNVDNAESVVCDALTNLPISLPETPTKALTAKEQAYKERTEYNARLAESQDMDFSQAPEFKAKTPVIAADGTAVTVPVDPENDPKGPRRELDASKGERLISEETITVKATPKPERLPEIDGLSQYIDAETNEMVYESRNVKSGLALDEPESVPTAPEGVNRNTWYMAHAADTQTARDWWLARANAQAEEFKANNGAPAPF